MTNNKNNKNNNNLSFWFMTGFIDAEGCFTISISPATKQVRARFEIGLNKKDTLLINRIQEFFGGVGRINFNPKAKAVHYTVASVKDLSSIIIPHFVKYPLLTQKFKNFILFKEVIDIMNSKEHLTASGLQKIANIKNKINNGLSCPYNVGDTGTNSKPVYIPD